MWTRVCFGTVLCYGFYQILLVLRRPNMCVLNAELFAELFDWLLNFCFILASHFEHSPSAILDDRQKCDHDGK